MGLITPGELSLFFSSACIICLMIDNKIFKGEAWSISLFLVFLVPFYNCMFEISFFTLRNSFLNVQYHLGVYFCCDMWLNLLNVTDKSSIYSCSYIAVHVYIRVLCAYLTITFCFRNDIWQLRSFDFRKPCFHMYFMNECQNHCISKLHTYWVEKIFLFCHTKGSNL